MVNIKINYMKKSEINKLKAALKKAKNL